MAYDTRLRSGEERRNVQGELVLGDVVGRDGEEGRVLLDHERVCEVVREGGGGGGEGHERGLYGEWGGGNAVPWLWCVGWYEIRSLG